MGFSQVIYMTTVDSHQRMDEIHPFSMFGTALSMQ
jgi:hypothetical protein